MTDPEKTITDIIRGGGETLKEAAARQNLSREARQLEQLRDWLSRPNWKSTESAMLLAGLDPELSFSETEGRWWLPGSDESLHPDEIADRLERVRGLRLPLLTPGEAIVVALAKKHWIPWLKIARADPECRKYLPPEALNASADAPRVPLIASEVASLGGKAKRDKDPIRKRFFPIVRELHESGVITAEIVRRLVDDFGDEPDENLPSPGTVYRWIGKIKAAAKAQEARGLKILSACRGNLSACSG